MAEFFPMPEGPDMSDPKQAAECVSRVFGGDSFPERGDMAMLLCRCSRSLRKLGNAKLADQVDDYLRRKNAMPSILRSQNSGGGSP